MKHGKTRRKPTDKQALIIIISVLCAAALLIGALIVIGPILGGNKNNSIPNDGHDHGNTGTTGHNSSDTNISTGSLSYSIYTNADKTSRLVVRDAAKKIVFEKDNLYKEPIKEDISDGLFTLGWATGAGPNDYEQIYCNEKTGQVSELFVAPRGCDGVRVAYPNEDQTKIIVQDVFNKDAYYKEYTLANAYTAGTDTIIGGKLQEDGKTVLVAYIINEKGQSHHTVINLYE